MVVKCCIGTKSTKSCCIGTKHTKLLQASGDLFNGLQSNLIDHMGKFLWSPKCKKSAHGPKCTKTMVSPGFIRLFLPPEDPSPVLLRPNSIPGWVHKECNGIEEEAITKLQEAWDNSEKKDECTVCLNDLEGAYWRGTEIGQLGGYGFQGVRLGVCRRIV